MKIRITRVVLLLIIALSLTVFALAAESGYYVAEAEQLKTLGVFLGTEEGLELTREPTRLEGLVMLIRLLGKEAEAAALADRECVFRDVPSWGVGYVNYAYDSGLTKGIGNGLFGSGDKMNSLQYTTFMLRALGYSDGGGDFTYSQSMQFARQIGLYSDADLAEMTDSTFLRDNVAKVSMLALGAKIKGSDITLLDKLVGEGVISEAAAAQIDIDSPVSLEVHFLDVGQADCIFITKGSEAMLIDGGNAEDSDEIISYIKNQNVRTLKYVIATHPHEDHIGGLPEIIKSFGVEAIIMPEAAAETRIYEDLLSAISEKELQITRPVRGSRYDLNGAVFEILASCSQAYVDLNDYSVVIKLLYGSNSFLFTGDAEEALEAEMLEKNSQILKCDVLKLGHHGSSSSTSQAFLDATNPKYAVISVGADNPYGHPDQSTLDRLAAKGVYLLRTDEHGNIISASNGRLIAFSTQPAVPSNESPSGSHESVVINSVDKIAELVTITNTGSSDVNLSGWVLLSVTGDQSFTFPPIILRAGESLTIASGGATGDLIWTSANIWNNSSSDPARLYDQDGSLIFDFAA